VWFGDVRGDLHGESTTYEAVVEEVAEDALWVPLAAEGDLNALHTLASQLLGGMRGADGPTTAPSSFAIGRLFEGIQGQLAEALGIELRPTDEEPAKEPPPEPAPPAPKDRG
jgi:hypothetical protein